MNHDQQLLKETQYPTSKYDYDGITGVWLLIPPKFHLLILAVLLPLILWVLPHINFKGNFRYIFSDYRYYFAAGISLFFIASALLSIMKAKQVGGKVRPTSSVGAQVIAKKGSSAKRGAKSRSTSKLSVKSKNAAPTKAKIISPQKSKAAPKEDVATGRKRRVTLKTGDDTVKKTPKRGKKIIFKQTD